MSSSHPPIACHLFVCHYNSCCHVIQLKGVLMHFPVNQRGVRYTSCVPAFKSKTTKQSYQPRCENSFLTSTSDIYSAGCTWSCVASSRQKILIEPSSTVVHMCGGFLSLPFASQARLVLMLYVLKKQMLAQRLLQSGRKS